MKILEHIGWIGGIASIVGMLITIWQVKKAIEAKSEVETIRDNLKKKYLDYELSHLRPKISLVANQLSKHTKSNSNFAQTGLSITDDIQRLKELLNEIRSNNLYSIKEVKENVDKITDLVNTNKQPYKFDEIVVYLTHTSREFDKKIKTEK
ncbi:hypothetical protein [uncultured Maribacter sp.]|uniref:hypothetical protein n=1 Tax=uncultured Maribacter sp. TaxID=431308 RepID=UPI002614CC82|nr:hypothetical protein [uncultured Maribacter sp.]